MNLFMTKTEAEKIEASLTEQEAKAWLKMVAWAAEGPGKRKPGLAADPDIACLPPKRINDMLIAVNQIMESR